MARAVDPHLVHPASRLWRVSYTGNDQRFSWIDPFQAESRRAGNRFDVPGGGVLYAASDVEGCFAETLARLRPSPAMLRLNFSADPHHMSPGSIARDWRLQRRKYELELVEPLPFVDVEHRDTRSWMSRRMGTDLERFDIDAIDVDDIRGKDRLLTREIARRIYTATDDDGEPTYSGIRYVSRLGDYECWAIFDGTEVKTYETHSIEHDDPHLQRIAQEYSLTLHR